MKAYPAFQGSIANKSYDHNRALTFFISWANSTSSMATFHFQSDLLGNDEVESWLSVETEERREVTSPLLCNTDDTRRMGLLICRKSTQDSTTDIGERSGTSKKERKKKEKKGVPGC